MNLLPKGRRRGGRGGGGGAEKNFGGLHCFQGEQRRNQSSQWEYIAVLIEN